MIVGLTGSIGTGKSAVANMFAELGAVVIDYDQLAREVVEPGTEGFSEILEEFGQGVAAPDGGLDRKKLGDLVFGDKDKLAALNRIVHPRVFEADAERTRQILDKDPAAVVIKEIPLLTQIGVDPRSMVDRVVVVTATRENQIRRVMGRGFTEKEAKSRVDAQAPPEDAEKHADYLIKNNGTLAELKTRVREVYAELEREARKQACRPAS
ncbi:MAG: dephospho-CoA kinase [Deltaproteobacteria bacterium]|nr:dephospho-CoA kinase [Deltaproteobacteria bacterium]